MKYLISQLQIHDIKLYVVQKPTRTHVYKHTHAHTLYASPFTQNRGRDVKLTLTPREHYWVLDFWTLQSQVTPKDTRYQKTFYKLGFEVCLIGDLCVP